MSTHSLHAVTTIHHCAPNQRGSRSVASRCVEIDEAGRGSSLAAVQPAVDEEAATQRLDFVLLALADEPALAVEAAGVLVQHNLRENRSKT